LAKWFFKLHTAMKWQSLYQIWNGSLSDLNRKLW
jgi:hypothetical protein